MVRQVCPALAVAVVLWTAVADAAPERSLHGVIIDQATTLPVEGAIVIGGVASATSDRDGSFAIVVAGEERELVITAPGYAMKILRIGDSSSLAINLVPTSTEVIDVSGTLPARPAAQAYHLTATDLRTLPGTGNDALRAVQALPGVARLPYSFGGIVLRGTSPRDNAVYLDGIEVPIAFHFGGVTSFYPSGMLSELKLENGGLDAAYGRVQGGIVSLTSREPRTDRWRTGGSVGLLDTSVFAEGPARGGGGVLIGLRRSYFDIVASPFAADDTPLPSYWDAQLRLSYGDPARAGRISPMAFLALDYVSTTKIGKSGHEDESTIRAAFVRIAAPYYRQWSKLGLHIVPWIGTNQLLFASKVGGVIETFERPVYPAGLRADLTRDLHWGELRGGLDAEAGHLTHFESGLGHAGDILQQVNGTTTLTWADVAAWGETRFAIDRISLRPGLRVEHYGLTGEAVVDPRLAVHERLTDDLVLREALGRYHQPPTAGDVDPYGGNPQLKSSYFDSSSLGLEGQRDDGWAWSVTGFASFGRGLGVRSATAMGDFSTLGALGPTFELLLEKQLGLAFVRTNVGRARNVGVELLVKRETRRWFGMLAYTLAKADRTDDPSVAVGWRPFELDQRHNLNVVGSVALHHWRLGARVQLVTGTPYSPTVPTGNGTTQIPWGGRLPMFFQLDLRADRVWQRCWGAVDLYFDIQNATNRRNVEGREPDDLGFGDTDVHGLPIVPYIGLEFVPK